MKMDFQASSLGGYNNKANEVVTPKSAANSYALRGNWRFGLSVRTSSVVMASSALTTTTQVVLCASATAPMTNMMAVRLALKKTTLA